MPKVADLKGLLQWRCIGPFRGGRVVAVAGDPVDPATFYFGACAGGVWKTTDGGVYWENVSDGFFSTASVGALEVAPSDPNVIYAGTGETTIRIDVSHGDGVYKSTDAGKTWTHMGLADTRHIAKIRVHPQNPDLVYVAALGHAFGKNEERGLFRSKDGGKTWEKVLYKSDKAGAIDLTIDPQNPRVLYAAIWEAYRSFWMISSGGPDCAIYKSTDGGDTWIDITRNEGFPKGDLGKIGVAASPAQTGRVWALIEAKEKEAGLYRSDDYGHTWQHVSDNPKLTSRSWYYIHLTADPQDAETVYVNNLAFWKSVGGGQNFTEIDTPHGDNHDLWIDPNNNRRMIQGNDGGANVSFNGSDTWSTIYNQPTAQFYHICADNQQPFYRVYGTQQDNTSVSVPSSHEFGPIDWTDCYVAGTGESGYIAVHPKDANIVYVGAIGSSPGGGNALQRYDHRTRQIRLVTTWPEPNEGYGAEAHKYRFAWTYPILFSPHDTNTIYCAGNVVFKSTDEGTSWQPISPDLTRADPETLKPTGGPINLDSLGAEIFATVFAFIESPREQGVFWAGSDDGLIHLSKNGGQNWQTVTPKDLPEWTLISCIEPSPYDPATVYVAGTRYKLDDYRPYLYKTNDYGQSWQRINSGIPDHDFTRVIRADPVRRGLLYAGAETGLYVSFDDGANWERFMLNLPVAPVHDLIIKDNDLIAGTHGRSIWILDDLTPLHHLNDDILAQAAHLFTPRDALRRPGDLFEGWVSDIRGKIYSASFSKGTTNAFYQTKTAEGIKVRRYLDSGQSAPKGVSIAYYLKEKPEAEISLAILDAAGNEIRKFSSKVEADEKAEAEAKAKEADKKEEEKGKVYLPANQGMNRFVWDMKVEDGVKVKGEEAGVETPKGPLAVPGEYQLQLTVGQQTLTTQVELFKDPRITTSQADLQKQFNLLLQIRDKLTEANTAINRMGDLGAQLDGWIARVKGQPDEEAVTGAAQELKKKLAEIEGPLIIRGLKTEYQAINHGARLVGKLASLVGVVSSADFAPTQQSYEFFDEARGKINAQLAALQQLIETDVAAFNKLIADRGVAALIPARST